MGLPQSVQVANAATRGDLVGITALLDARADPNGRDVAGHPALSRAARHGRIEVAELLLARRAAVDARSETKSTPLHYAATHGHVAAARLLLERRADANAVSSYAATPAFKASEGLCGDRRRTRDMLNLLLVYRADAHAECIQKRGWFTDSRASPLEMVAGSGVRPESLDAGQLDAEQLGHLVTVLSPEQRVRVMEAIARVAVPPQILQEKDAVDGKPKLLEHTTCGGVGSDEAVGDAAGRPLYDEYQGLLSSAQAEFSAPIAGFGPGDCLLIVNMQNDFLPLADAPDGGRLAVSEGAGASVVIVQLIRRAAAANALVVATRDYHPLNHRSFTCNSGSFPTHCVQGTRGSFFFPPVARALLDSNARCADTRVVFKGFREEVDSLGGLRYSGEDFVETSLGNAAGVNLGSASSDCCVLDWTGSFCLECSNIVVDINAPPDVHAALDCKALSDELESADIRRLFVTGLALDLCVLDSALNASAAGLAPDGVFIVVDAARAAHVPGVGSFGSGFLSDPRVVVSKSSAQGVNLIESEAIGF